MLYVEPAIGEDDGSGQRRDAARELGARAQLVEEGRSHRRDCRLRAGLRIPAGLHSPHQPAAKEHR
jgi:hypothetical protein